MQIQTKRKLEYPYLDKLTKKKTNKRQKKRGHFLMMKRSIQQRI